MEFADARITATFSLIVFFVALAPIGMGAASHSTLTATLSPEMIDHNMWRNFTATVRNQGPEPVNITQVGVEFSWSRLSYVVNYDYGTPDPIPVDGTRTYRLGDLDVTPVPTNGIGLVNFWLEGRHWNFSFEVGFDEPKTVRPFMSLELAATVAIVAAVVAVPIMFVLLRRRHRRPH
ncbi:MAG TPA: hypothetical protein VEO20_03545 [Thermoplasmata archaeon]|nr:hypothetical protein [Thermoplasmata archaeon]